MDRYLGRLAASHIRNENSSRLEVNNFVRANMRVLNGWKEVIYDKGVSARSMK